MTAGFFETHRPYPADRYEPADRTAVAVPDYLPETDEVRQDLAEFYGSITVADAAVGQLLDTLAGTGLDRTTWVVFMTDHGPALPRAKSTLYDAGTGIAVIVRPPLRTGSIAARLRRPVQRRRPAAHAAGPARGRGACRRRRDVACTTTLRTASGSDTPVRSEVYTTKTYHDSFDPIRAIRTKEYSYIENYAIPPAARPAVGYRRQRAGNRGRAIRRRPASGARTVRPARRPDRVTTTCSARTQRTRRRRSPNELALLLNDWRQKTNDVIPSEFAGTRISERYTETYRRIHGRAVTSRSAIAAERGIEDEHS